MESTGGDNHLGPNKKGRNMFGEESFMTPLISTVLFSRTGVHLQRCMFEGRAIKSSLVMTGALFGGGDHQTQQKVLKHWNLDVMQFYNSTTHQKTEQHNNLSICLVSHDLIYHLCLTGCWQHKSIYKHLGSLEAHPPASNYIQFMATKHLPETGRSYLHRNGHTKPPQ